MNADRRGAEAEDWDGYSAATRASYEKNWRTFECYCASVGAVALPAAPGTVGAFIGAAATGALRRPGKSRLQSGEPTPFSASMLDVMLSAIRHRHLCAGFASPTEDPAVRAAQRRYRTDRVEARPAPQRAVAATKEDLRALCSSEVEVLPSRLVVAASVLTALALGGVGSAALMALRLRDLSCGDQVRLRVEGRWQLVECTCTRMWTVWSVPPCAACLLRLLERGVADEGALLFGGWPSRGDARPRAGRRQLDPLFRVWARRLAERWPALEWDGRVLRWSVESSANERAWTGHGLGLALTGQLRMLRLRALLLTMFRRGLRFDDARRLRLATTSRRPGGYRLLLPAAKNDPLGEGHWLHLLPTREAGLCPVCALDEWVGVVAVCGQALGAALFCSVDSRGPRAGGELNYSETWQDLTELRCISGVEAPLSLHSLRRGFATLALEQGAKLEQIQRGLRHKRPDTTKPYVDLPQDGDVPDGVLRLAGRSAAERAVRLLLEIPRRHGLSDHDGGDGVGVG